MRSIIYTGLTQYLKGSWSYTSYIPGKIRFKFVEGNNSANRQNRFMSIALCTFPYNCSLFNHEISSQNLEQSWFLCSSQNLYETFSKDNTSANRQERFMNLALCAFPFSHLSTNEVLRLNLSGLWSCPLIIRLIGLRTDGRTISKSPSHLFGEGRGGWGRGVKGLFNAFFHGSMEAFFF